MKYLSCISSFLAGQRLLLLMCLFSLFALEGWGTATTGTINFGSGSGDLNVNAASVSGNDDKGNNWRVTTTGTTSFTPNADYAQVGSSSKPATTITFAMKFPASHTFEIGNFSAKFGGFGDTAGTITLKVNGTSVGTGALSGTSDVTVSSTSAGTGDSLTVKVTGISKGVKCYWISYTYENVTYTVSWEANGTDWSGESHGSPSTSVDGGDKVTTLPTAPVSSDCDGRKVFLGWTNSTYSNASTAPTTLFSTVAGAPAVNGDVTYYAVFATSGSVSKEFEMSISYSDFNSTSYSANDGSHTSTATATDDSGVTTSVSWTSSNVMRGTGTNSSKIQFKNTPGYFYNTTDLSSINSLTVTSGTNITSFQNSTSNPTSNGTPKQYFRVYSNGSTAYAESITVNFTKSVTVYSNYATSCCTKRDITLANNGKAKGGTYSADYSSTCAGTTVTLSASSNNADSVFSSWTVCKTGDAGTTVTVTDNQFSMPDYNVTVSATFAAKVQTPTFSLSAGTYSNDQSLTLSTATEGATLYYTLTTNSSDPATPTNSSTEYTGAITIDHNDTRIKVIAVKSGFTDSEVSSGTYYFKCATPTFSLAEDTYLGSQNVSLATTTTSAAIHYTTDESTPSGSSTTYSDALTVSSSQTIKAIATKPNYQNSDVASAAYTITPASTVAWYVNGSELSGGDLGSAPTLVATDSKVSAVPPAPANNTLNSCANTFMGWSTTNIGTTPVTAAASITALGLFTDAASSPTIASNTTFYAVFAERTQSSPDVNTVLWSENFDGMKNSATPTSPGSGAVVYGDATITYTCANGGGTSPGETKVQSNNYAGGTSPEMMVGQKGTGVDTKGGYFYASGIPSEGAAALTVSYKQNGYDLDVTTSGTGYSGSNSSKIAGAKSFDVTVGSASTFELKFQSGSTNVRLDDIEVKVKTAGYMTTNYVTRCSDVVARVTYNANGGSVSSCTSGVYTKAGFTLCSTEPTKAGYSFSGWSDGTSTHDAGAVFTLTGDTTFTAQWTAKVDTYIDNMHGNEIDDASTRGVYTVPSLTDESTATEGICSVRHYKFIGWVAESDVDSGGLPTDTPFGSGDEKAATGTTYYAVWAEEITE